MAVMIETKYLSKQYGKLAALKGINLTIDESQVMGFIGPNGAGKTTTLRIIATLLRPTSGKAFINGIDVMKNPYEVKKLVGFMPDSFGVYDGMRLSEYLDFFGAAYKIPVAKRKSIIDDVLELTDLTSKADDFVSTFSRGMKQRCCLAKTLIHDPKVLLLDEPASGLDPRARIEIRELIKTLRNLGKTIFISSHILTELADMCDHFAIIENGALLAVGNLDEIYAQTRKPRAIQLKVIDDAGQVETILNQTPGISFVEHRNGEFRFEADFDNAKLSELLNKIVGAGIKVVFFGEEKETLEDVFMQITKGKL